MASTRSLRSGAGLSRSAARRSACSNAAVTDGIATGIRCRARSSAVTSINAVNAAATRGGSVDDGSVISPQRCWCHAGDVMPDA